MKAAISSLIALTILSAAVTACRGPQAPHSSPYWIQKKTGKTHNSHCRYYYNCKGYPAHQPTNNNCKKCGGATRLKYTPEKASPGSHSHKRSR